MQFIVKLNKLCCAALVFKSNLAIHKGIKACMMCLHMRCLITASSGIYQTMTLCLWKVFIMVYGYFNSDYPVWSYILNIAWQCTTPGNSSEELLLPWGRLLTAGRRSGSGGRCQRNVLTSLPAHHAPAMLSCEPERTEKLNIWRLKVPWPWPLKNTRDMWRAKGRSWEIWRAVRRGNLSHTAMIKTAFYNKFV